MVKSFENTDLLDVLTPSAIDFKPNTVMLGDHCCRILAVSNYPPRVNIGWLSRICNIEGVMASIHLEVTDAAHLIENINKSIGTISANIKTGGNALSLQRWQQQFEDANTLLQKIDREQENVFYMSLIIMVVARDYEALQQKSRRIEATIAGAKMKARTAIYRQEDGVYAAGPFGTLPKQIREMSSRNMPASTAAGSFPFDIAGINDGQGIILGRDGSGGLVIIDNWLRGGDRTNSNWTLLGSPGVGKSATIKHILLSEYAIGTKIIIIDPEREYKDMCSNLQGQWINCGGAGGVINPLQAKDTPQGDDDDASGSVGASQLTLHFQTLRTFFKLYMRSLSTIDEANLEEALEILYRDFNIKWDTDTSKIKNGDWPTILDLYNKLISLNETEEDEKKRSSYKTLSSLLRRAAVGSEAMLWSGHTSIEARNDFIVLDTFDLQEADEQTKRTQYFNLLTWCWHQISRDREERALLGVDEAYLMVDPEVPQALSYLRNASKRVRKYNAGLMVITHSVVDFLDEPVKRFGQALLDNPCFKFYMGTDGKNLQELTALANLTEAEQEMLAKKKRGEGLFIAGSARTKVNVTIPDFELKIFGKGGGN